MTDVVDRIRLVLTGPGGDNFKLLQIRDLVMGPEHGPFRCGVDVSSRPSWMSGDQYDPCRCVKPRGHLGPHKCKCDIEK